MPSDAYMELETRDLIGETFDQKFGMDDPLARREGAFEIFSFDFAVLSNRPDKDDDPKSAAKPGDGKPSSQTDGPPTTGKDHPTVREFTIKKSIDKSSSRLFLLCCEKTPIKWAIISVREQGDQFVGVAGYEAPKPWLILEFTDVYVDEWSWDLNPEGGGQEAERVKFRFTTILIKYFQQIETGEHKPMIARGWDRSSNSRAVAEVDKKSETWGGR